jgi:hypothetical protein
MNKTITFVATVLLLGLILPTRASAKLISIQDNGEIVWSVLSSGVDVDLEIPKASNIEVKEAANSKPAKDAKISLQRDGEKVSMVVNAENYEKELDVTDWEESVIEIEERPELRQITINVIDGRFAIKQRNITALTDYPISVDSKTAKLSVTTESGDRLVSILPYNAVESLVRTRIITRIAEGGVDLVEEERELTYKVSGEKLLNLFNVYEHPVQMDIAVSASTGEIVKIEAPIWYKAISFLFT